MTTILCDAIEHAGPPRSTDRHRELFAKGFAEADFYLKDGKPYAVFSDWDYAEYWGAGAVREVHPFGPIIGGVKITETQFRALVRGLHGIQ